MTDKMLIEQLNNLSSVSADLSWKERNREVLLAQISASAEAESGFWRTAYTVAIQFLPRSGSQFLQPALAAMIALISLTGVSFFSARLARDTKPGDSLYGVKIASEKTQLALTFSDDSRAKLGLEIAQNRAEELSAVISDQQVNNPEKAEQVGRLAADLKKEIETSKTRLSKISQSGGISTPKPIVKTEVATSASSSKIAELSSSSEAEIFTLADSGHEESGLSVSDPAQALRQAGDALGKKDYQATLEKLEEAGQAISSLATEAGDVKGATEELPLVEPQASSTKTGSVQK